jgi:hypothetical protein
MNATPPRATVVATADTSDVTSMAGSAMPPTNALGAARRLLLRGTTALPAAVAALRVREALAWVVDGPGIIIFAVVCSSASPVCTQ